VFNYLLLRRVGKEMLAFSSYEEGGLKMVGHNTQCVIGLPIRLCIPTRKGAGYSCFRRGVACLEVRFELRFLIGQVHPKLYFSVAPSFILM